MYTSILVPVATDHDRNVEGAFAVARQLCSPGGTIHALTVQEHITAFSEAYVPHEVQVQITDAIKADFDRMVPDDITARAFKHGAPAQQILAHAKEIKADCIVIASHKPGLQDYFLGSTANRVVRHAACAVHVLR